jgi:hypothetical protein
MRKSGTIPSATTEMGRLRCEAGGFISGEGGTRMPRVAGENGAIVLRAAGGFACLLAILSLHQGFVLQ